ncbi:hypothetical protein BD779DRAFT_1465155 [Infundibulicybe gibba]|nr:hypothetical protein BD779DRAFT_1465155 [Infundibulicybe gibba]
MDEAGFKFGDVVVNAGRLQVLPVPSSVPDHGDAGKCKVAVREGVAAGDFDKLETVAMSKTEVRNKTQSNRKSGFVHKHACARSTPKIAQLLGDLFDEFNWGSHSEVSRITLNKRAEDSCFICVMQQEIAGMEQVIGWSYRRVGGLRMRRTGNRAQHQHQNGQLSASGGRMELAITCQRMARTHRTPGVQRKLSIVDPRRKRRGGRPTLGGSSKEPMREAIKKRGRQEAGVGGAATSIDQTLESPHVGVGGGKRERGGGCGPGEGGVGKKDRSIQKACGWGRVRVDHEKNLIVGGRRADAVSDSGIQGKGRRDIIQNGWRYKKGPKEAKHALAANGPRQFALQTLPWSCVGVV